MSEEINEKEVLGKFQDMSSYLRALQKRVIDMENEKYENKFFFLN
jgi:hypothetical protein